MAPVLANKTPHIRSFAAEAFGFLLRRVPLGENKLETVLQALWDLLRTESAHIELADDEMVDGESIPVPVFQDVPAEVEDIESEFAKDEVSHTVIANAVRPLVAGAATLILESMTHVRGILHSRASGLLGSLLDLSLGPGNGFGNSLDGIATFPF